MEEASKHIIQGWNGGTAKNLIADGLEIWTEANKRKNHEKLVNLCSLIPNISSKRHHCQEFLLKRGNLANISR